MWEIATPPGAPQSGGVPDPPPQLFQRPEKRKPQREQPKHQPASKPRTASALRDGRAVCKLYNEGRCSNPCPKDMAHVCSAIIYKSGRVCGMRNHRASECRNAFKGA